MTDSNQNAVELAQLATADSVSEFLSALDAAAECGKTVVFGDEKCVPSPDALLLKIGGFGQHMTKNESEIISEYMKELSNLPSITESQAQKLLSRGEIKELTQAQLHLVPTVILRYLNDYSADLVQDCCICANEAIIDYREKAQNLRTDFFVTWRIRQSIIEYAKNVANQLMVSDTVITKCNRVLEYLQGFFEKGESPPDAQNIADRFEIPISIAASVLSQYKHKGVKPQKHTEKAIH